MNKALSHLRVLDLSRVLAGPWATQNLADLGAEVIKIEKPGAGDDSRSWGPPFLRDKDGNETFDSSYFLSANRAKKSLTLDIARPAGQAIVRELAGQCDILVENYKVGNLARYGLGYEDLRAINPKLIYCSITGYGQEGPSAHLPGYDFIFQGRGGIMALTGNPDGEPGEGPLKSGVSLVDLTTGLYATIAILAAIEHRNRTGEGQYLDMALLDCVVALTSFQAANLFVGGRRTKRLGNGHPNIVPYQVFQCREGEMIVAVGNDAQYVAFCTAIGRADLADDPRFNSGARRLVNRADLIPQIASVMRSRTMQEWVPLLEAAGVPCGPINSLEQVFDDPQVKLRGMRVDVPHAAGVLAPGVASPLRLSASPVTYDRAAPSLGQHSDEVLRGLLGKTPAEIEALRREGVV